VPDIIEKFLNAILPFHMKYAGKRIPIAQASDGLSPAPICGRFIYHCADIIDQLLGYPVRNLPDYVPPLWFLAKRHSLFCSTLLVDSKIQV
jgi:hypothetical protein